MVRNNILILKEIVLNLLGNKCKKCKTTERLELHHKDNNYKNNKINNIILLCKSCHMTKHSLDRSKEYNDENNIKFYNKYNLSKKLTKICPKCHKIIMSQYPIQLKFNYKQHQKKHNRKKYRTSKKIME